MGWEGLVRSLTESQCSTDSLPGCRVSCGWNTPRERELTTTPPYSICRELFMSQRFLWPKLESPSLWLFCQYQRLVAGPLPAPYHVLTHLPTESWAPEDPLAPFTYLCLDHDK